MKKQYHILNGDALKQQLPESIEGEIIVARECLVEGNVQGYSLDELFKSRAAFICQNYPEVTEKNYYDKSATEFLKIKNINVKAEINLWFEEDLFCQVNFWFVLYLLNQLKQTNPVYIVKPKTHNQYGFGELNHSELNAIYQNRKLLIKIDKLASLWTMYQNNDTVKMLTVANELQSQYPFLLPAVKAHIARIPNKDNPGKPTQSLIQIIKDLNTEDFESVFNEFSKRESIYGFGDSQVMRLLEKIKCKSP